MTAPGALEIWARSGTELSTLRRLRRLIRARPGDTQVVLHVETPDGRVLPMELMPVAYGPDLLSEIRGLGDLIAVRR